MKWWYVSLIVVSEHSLILILSQNTFFIFSISCWTLDDKGNYYNAFCRDIDFIKQEWKNICANIYSIEPLTLQCLLVTKRSHILTAAFSKLKYHFVKSVQIRSIFWSVFSPIRTEYGDLLLKSLYSVWIRENTPLKRWCRGVRRFKSYTRRVGDLRRREPRIMVPYGNKTERPSLVNQSAKTIHHSILSLFAIPTERGVCHSLVYKIN